MARFGYKKQGEHIKKLILSGLVFAQSFEPVDETSLSLVHLRSFIYKATGLLESILALITLGQVADAQILMRVLVEEKINVDYLLMLYKKEGDMAFLRIADAIMLSKNKAVNSTDWGAEFQKKSKTWDKLMIEIESHYPAEEFRKIKSHGVFGCNIEERARRTGNLRWYSDVYRLYSKQVHCLDLHEIFIEKSVSKKHKAHIVLREQALLSMIPMCAGGIFVSCSKLKDLIDQQEVVG